MWRNFTLVSDDSHLEVAPENWGRYVDPEFAEYVPKTVEHKSGGDAWLLPGGQIVPLGLQFAAGRDRSDWRLAGISYADNPAGSGDSIQRLAEMDRDGVEAETLFPAISGQRGLDGKVPPDAYVGLARAYNDWLSQEYTAPAPDRLLGCGLLPISTAQDAADELRRVAAMPGIATVVLHQWPNGSKRPVAEQDDVFWRAVVETGVPLSIHAWFGGGVEADIPDDEFLKFMVPVSAILTKGSGGPRGETGYCMTQLITTGVFDRFPDLRIHIAECGAGWTPFYAENADSFWERYRRNEWANMQCIHPPSHYIFRHFLWGIQDDFVAVQHLRHRIGVENIVWGTDFPHSATDWPESHALLDQVFDGVPDDEIRKMVGGNMADFYKLPIPSTAA